MKRIAIVGAGISGLTAAWYLKQKYQKTIELFIFEEKVRTGGLIRTERQKDFLFEWGPRGFRPSGKGKATLKLVHDLGLEKELTPANPKAKRRYIYTQGHLQLFSPLFLLKKGLLGALLKDLTTARSSKEDETVAEFASRRFNRKILENVIDPLACGIFGASPDKLSMPASFPSLWNLEKTYRSILKGAFLSRKKTEGPALFSFKNGMQTLVDALATQLSEHLFLSTSMQRIDNLKKGFCLTLQDRQVEVDAVISTTAKEHPIASTITLATVNLGWYGKKLPLTGYGFLMGKKERDKILGVTFDSEIFPEQNTDEMTRLCVMIQNETDHEKLFSMAQLFLKELFQISEKPDAVSIHVANNGIAYYPLGHTKQLSELRASLAKNYYVTGRYFDGPGVNDCIESAAHLAFKF